MLCFVSPPSGRSFFSSFNFNPNKMSSIQSICHFPCQILQKSSHNPNLIATNAFHCSNRIQFPAISIKKSINVNRDFAVRAADEGDWVRDEASTAAVLEADPAAEATDIENLKKKLVDSFYGTNWGLCAPSETKAVIVELISQLEANNPTPAPTEALALLTGKWILAYTSFPGFFPLLSMDESLQLVKIDEISQTIDSENFTVQNSVIFSGPLATTEISTNAKFEVRSPKRVQIMFEEGVIGTPQLTDSIVLPEYVEFFGTRIDLSPLKSLLIPVHDSASYVARNISSRPPFKFCISDYSKDSWLLTTYLDDDVRISRDDVGSIYVLIKAGSPLFTP